MDLLSSLFSIGDYVTLNLSGECGWIVYKHDYDEEDKILLLDLRMELNGNIVRNVCSSNVTVITYYDNEADTVIQTRSMLNSDNNINQDSDNAVDNTAPNFVGLHSISLQTLYSAIKDCFSWRKYNTKNKLYMLLKTGLLKPCGWVRDVIASKRIEENTHMSQHENMVLTTISCLFSGFAKTDPVLTDHVQMTQHAFGIKNTTHKEIVKRLVATDYTLACRERSDKGRSVFNSHSKRVATFTAFNVFKKRRNRGFRKTTSRIPHEVLVDEFENLPHSEKEAYNIIAERDRNRAVFLWDELKALLLRTKGKISYTTMATQLGNIVCLNTVRKWLQQQEGFHVRKDRILPSLDQQAKTLRVIWAHSFWMFWYSAKLVNTQKAIFVLVHMDEKWFYAVRTRSNCKVLTSIGLEQADYRAHHKNHIGKEMYIVVTAYVLREGNDITKGGIAIPVSLVRVGRMVKATKDSYKRVYNDDGTYSYPKVATNLLRRKGEVYFKPCELTGSNEGTEFKPKVSLLKVYKDTIIPDLEEKIVRRFSNNGVRQVVIVKQEDGAGLHQDCKYLAEMQKMFDERGWILFRQPLQSPVTNVHDACVFLMMSKAVSTLQALIFGSTLLKGEQLYQTVKEVWDDDSNHLAMSCAFAGHHQVVLSIMAHEGDNKYLVEKGGLSFGIRSAFVLDQEGKGVIPVPLAPTTEGETTQGGFLSERASRQLKYLLPAVSDLDKFRLDKYMIKRLYDLMDMESMPADMQEVWDDIILSAETDSDPEEDENYGIEMDYNGSTDEEAKEASTITIYSRETRSEASSMDISEDCTLSDDDTSSE